MAAKPTELRIAVGVATTFGLLAFAGVWLNVSCDLTTDLSPFEQDVCDSSGPYVALILVALPVLVLLAGSMSRRTGWPSIFYSAWAVGLACGLGVLIWTLVAM